MKYPRAWALLSLAAAIPPLALATYVLPRGDRLGMALFASGVCFALYGVALWGVAVKRDRARRRDGEEG
jgi:Ca2+/H+ antiporter